MERLMNIVICGAGDVGRHCAEVFVAKGDNVTMLDLRAARLTELEGSLDVRTLAGNGTHADTLLEAGVARADLFIAATDLDEVNLLSGSVAKGVGARQCVARVHHRVYFEAQGLDYGRHLGIDHLVCPEFSTAVAIAQVLRSPGALAVERFAQGRIQFAQLPVADNAPAVGRNLAELKLPAATRLAAVERDGQAFLPDGTTVIRAGDVVSIIGDVEKFETARYLFQADAPPRSSVVISGGTSMGVWLARALRGRDFSLRLFESDPQRCRELADKLDWVTVLQGDATDDAMLEEEHIERADVLVAVSEDDEHNILAAARAKSIGVQRAVAVVNRSAYLHLIRHIGIDHAFSPRTVAAAEILRLLEPGPVRHLASLAQGVAHVYEVQVKGGSKDVVGQSLARLRFPTTLMIAAIEREGEVHVPGAGDSIEEGDGIVVIGPEGIEKTLRKFFLG
jgi:trk system potassium uptake protein TrkA